MRNALIAAVAAVGMIVPALPAAAVETASERAAEVTWEFGVLGTCATVFDPAGHFYTAVLSTQGGGTDGGRTRTINDYDTASGNPATVCTLGGFDSNYIVVTHTLIWTSVGGSSGTCVATSGVPVCTPT